MQCVYLTYPVLKQHVQYTFEPCEGDIVDHVTADHTSAAATLAREASRWAARIARETANIHEYQNKLQNLAQLRESGQKVNHLCD